MKAKGLHEGCIEQMERLFAERLYTADKKVPVDADNRIRMDDWELDPAVQAEVDKIMPTVTEENVKNNCCCRPATNNISPEVVKYNDTQLLILTGKDKQESDEIFELSDDELETITGGDTEKIGTFTKDVDIVIRHKMPF